MRTCTRCGANAYVDADPYCEHAYHEPPEPSVSPIYMLRSEWSGAETLYEAAGPIGPAPNHTVIHPTREGAIALWQERWTWGPAIAALFGWLCERPASEPIGSAKLRGVRLADGTLLSVSTGTYSTFDRTFDRDAYRRFVATLAGAFGSEEP